MRIYLDQPWKDVVDITILLVGVWVVSFMIGTFIILMGVR